MSLRTFLIKLNQDPAYTGLCQLLAEQPRAHAWITGLWGSAAPFFWSGVRERMHRPMLLVVPTLEEARSLYDRLRLFIEHPDPDREELFLFPSRELLVYENALPDLDIEGERLEVLLKLAQGNPLVVVAASEQLREKLPDPVWLLDRTITLAKGQHVDVEKLTQDLIHLGYTREAMVEGRGQFAIRGGILDIFSPADLSPWRIELAGTEIFSLRQFHLAISDSTVPSSLADQVWITPSRMICPSAQELKKGMADWERQQGRESLRSIREMLENDPYAPGLENYLLRFIPTTSLLDYLPANTIVVFDSPGAALKQAEADDHRNLDLYQARVNKAMHLPKPTELFWSFATVGEAIAKFSLVQTGRLKQSVWPEAPGLLEWSMVIKATTPMHGNIELLVREAQALQKQGLELHLVANNAAEERRLKQILAERAATLEYPDLVGRFTFHLGHLTEGFQYPACHLVVFTDQELFNRHLGRPKPRRQKGLSYPSQPIADILELKAGDLAVHRDHGVARYLGVVKLNIDGSNNEFVALAYAGEEKLYIPTDQLHLVEKYIGGEHAPRINRLGTPTWEKTKQKVKESVAEMARQLLDVYASRQVNEAHVFGPDTELQREFEEAFPYEETPDQDRAILEVKKDMETNKPMDRLICGDVGYGKTEVAMRAAFKAVQDGFQVAVLVPTTILADQHYTTFRERMATYPVRVALLSRFRNPAEQKQVLEEITQGKVDIVIGTHRLLGKDIKFNNLGLFVLDEEQHFGVAQKEKLKQFRSVVDVLTLTATPIPRTLYLSLSGIRDISIIETPPLNRLPIRTQVLEFSESVIREAILREMGRGGQVFFIHNRVQNILSMAERVKKLVPEARVAVAHGQMKQHELEHVMEKFVSKSEDVLVSTTIVESGLDLPNVNTILINRADALGISQLYQLRGRVGRADRQAYAYLFYPLGGAVTANAEKRMMTLQEFTELGAGIKIAMRDLEIRGAGDVLGPEQSGQVTAVGFETYCSLLEEAVRELKGQQKEAPAEVKISIPHDAYLPSDYVPDAVARLNLYKRISSTRELQEIQQLRQEMESRFGTLPPAAQPLFAVAEIRLLARKAKLREVLVGNRSLQLKWIKYYQPATRLIDRLLANTSRRLRFMPGEQPGLEVGMSGTDLLSEVKKFLSELISGDITN